MFNPMRLFFLLSLLFASVGVSAQRHRLYNTPTKLLFDSKVYSVYYEFAINKKLSIQLGLETGRYVDYVDWVFEEGGTANKYEYWVQGYGISPEIKYYPLNKKKSARGLFVGAYYRYRSVKEYEVPRYDISFAKTNDYGISLGYKIVFGICIIEPLIGYGSSNFRWKEGYYSSGGDEINYLSTNSYNQFGELRYELSVGFAFGRGI